jgi:ATP-dependent DNA ligase
MALSLTPPLDPMLAKLQKEIPRGEGWRYEPKWDGFRALVFHDTDDTTIYSRDRKPLNRYFPELPIALSEALPGPCVIDGEIVIMSDKGLAFDSLLQRIHPAASRVALLARETPGGFVAFDLLASGEQDLREHTMDERRGALVSILGEGATPPSRPGTFVVTTPQTDDYDLAREWFTGFEKIGLDGIIAKRFDSPYVHGKRAMVKVKHQRTADCVVGGYRLSKQKDGVGSLLLGLYDDDGVLHYVGHTSSFKAAERRELLATLHPLEGKGGFGDGRSPGGPSRWNQGKADLWVGLEPVLVCEVAYDYMQGERFRHATRLLRWRTDKKPRECTFDQLTA